MKKNKLRATRISKLSKGKVKGIGFIEGIGLRIAGRIDGKRGLPRKHGGSGWNSPRLDRELRSFDEFSSRMWGLLQIEVEDEYARLDELMDSIKHVQEQLKSAKEELEKALSDDKTPSTARKHGESKLTDAQVAARRATEKAQRLAPLKSRVSSFQSKLASETNELNTLRSRIIEQNNSTRMICTRVWEHLLQRIDVYWGSAMRKHPEKDQMPVVPSIEAKNDAERIYMGPHKKVLDAAEALSQALSNERREEK